MKDKIVKKAAKKVVYSVASKSANRVCTIFFYQPKMLEAVKKLRKF